MHTFPPEVEVAPSGKSGIMSAVLSSTYQFPRAVGFGHQLLERVLIPGAYAIDATCGNGHDSLFLAERVGSQGKVAAFDVQAQALEATRERLAAHGQLDQVRLLASGHEMIAQLLPEWRERVRAIVFNLGYLPGGERRVVTSPGTTLEGLRQALEWLEPGGLLTVALYTGHEGGKDESEAVMGLLRSLPQRRFEVIHYSFVNQRNDPPSMAAVSKRPF